MRISLAEASLWVAPIDSPGDALVAEPKWELLGGVENVEIEVETPDVVWEAQENEETDL